MSYCRISEKNCDIYAYASGEAYEIHVGRTRMKPGEKIKTKLSSGSFEKWNQEYKDKTSPIGLPYDGQSFSCETLPEFKEKLLMLRNVGYKFPNRVIKQINTDIKNGDKR